MDSYSFEVAAKNAVIDVLKENGIEVSIVDLQLVWFAHIVGSKKCLIWGQPMQNKYAEVTYSMESDMMYIDLYEKKQHKQLYTYEVDTEAHV